MNPNLGWSYQRVIYTGRYSGAAGLTERVVDKTKMAINQWPEAERPREKLLTKGAGALSLAELLRRSQQGNSLSYQI
jgi:hypothetical protein